MDTKTHYLKIASSRWEMLRLVYTLVLLTEAFVCPAHVQQYIHGKTSLGYLCLIILFVVCANACYCLGPLIEIGAYIFIGWPIRGVRYFIFIIGLLFSVFVVNPCLVLPWTE